MGTSMTTGRLALRASRRASPRPSWLSSLTPTAPYTSASWAKSGLWSRVPMTLPPKRCCWSLCDAPSISLLNTRVTTFIPSWTAVASSLEAYPNPPSPVVATTCLLGLPTLAPRAVGKAYPRVAK